MTGTVAFGIIVLIVLGVLYTLKDTPGCTGDCNQGRSPCNCKNK
jgi:hypothetical protein